MTDLCESELKRPRKTESLKGIIDKLHREEKVPPHIITSMDHLNSLSTYVTHPKEFDPEQVRPILLNLATIIKWYVKYKDTKIISRAKPEEVKNESKEPMNTREGIRKPKKGLIFLLSGIILVVVIIVVALFVFNIIGGGKQTKEIEKSIAVLPFVNDSQDEENTYFINGIMDEFLINLQTIKELRVISRTSVEKYRGPGKRSIPEIAKELGVNYIVEGSGQKYGNTISLRIQLLRAAKESHLWGESYEQEINEVNDILSIQSQIAESIAKELEAVITPQEEDLIQQIPTNNSLAYDYYLKGKQYTSELKYDLAIEMYSKAIEQDPEFELAYLARASSYARIYFARGTEYGLSGDWKGFDSQAKTDLQKALNINPNLPEVKFVQADLLYRIDRNHDKALALLDEIKNQMPNNSLYFMLRGAILRRKGQWEGSLMDHQKAILLDPLNVSGYIEAAHTCRMMRRYPEAIEFFDKSLLLDQNPENLWGRIGTILLWKGSLEEDMKFEEITKFGYNNYLGFNYYYYSRQYDKLITIADKIEYLLTIPGDLSVPVLKIDPLYDKLSDLPRFQKILTTEYKTNY